MKRRYSDKKDAMCIAILDLALVLSVVALTLWILAFTCVIPVFGGFIHLLLVFAVLLFVVWLLFSVFGVLESGGYRRRYRWTRQEVL